MSVWAMSASEVLQQELAAACFFCCSLLLLLLQVLLLHEDTHTRCRCRTRAYRQPEATLSQTGKKQEIRSAPLSGQAWPIQASGEFFGQQNAAVESRITQIWLYYNMLPKHD